MNWIKLISVTTLLSLAQAEDTAKISRYLDLLKQHPEKTIFAERLEKAWFAEDHSGELTGWLQQHLNPQDAADQIALASWHLYKGHSQVAKEALDQAIILAPHHSFARLQRARLLGQLLEFEKALSDLAEIPTDTPYHKEAHQLEGHFLVRTGRRERGLAVWKSLLAEHPTDRELLQDLIDLQLEEGLIKEAVAGQRRLIEMAPDAFVKQTERLRLAQLLEPQDHTEAIKIYRDLIASSGEDSWFERESLARLEESFMRRENRQGWLDLCKTLRREHPLRISLSKAMALQLMKHQQPEAAIALYRDILQRTPGDDSNYNQFLDLLEQGEQWTILRDELTARLGSIPTSLSLLKRLLTTYHQLGDEDKLNDTLTEMDRIIGQAQADDWQKRAVLARDHGRPERALATLREGHAHFPESVPLARDLAQMLLATQEPDQIEVGLKLWTSLGRGGDRSDLLQATTVLRQHGQEKAAFSLLIVHMAKATADLLVLDQIIAHAREQKQIDQALPFVLRTIDAADDSASLQRATAQLVTLSRKGKVSPPAGDSLNRSCARAALASSSEGLDAARNILASFQQEPIAYWMLSHFAEQMGVLDEAIRYCRQTLELSPKVLITHRRRLIHLLQRNGQLKEAITELTAWKQVSPGDPSTWRLHVSLLRQDWQTDQALRQQQRLIARFGPSPERSQLLIQLAQEAGQEELAISTLWQTYEKSRTTKEKVQHIRSLVTLSPSEEHQKSILAELAKRVDQGGSSVATLLALAEVQELLNRPEDRTATIEKAAASYPGETVVLLELAREQAARGQLPSAIRILQRLPGSEARHTEALLQIQFGDPVVGVEKFLARPGSRQDPRKLEKLVVFLIQADATALARTTLQSHLAQHPHDWRLSYLHGLLLQGTNQTLEARSVFKRLAERSWQDLPRLSGPTLQVTSLRSNTQSHTGAYWGISHHHRTWFSHHKPWLQFQISQNLQALMPRPNYGSQTGKAILRLPDTPAAVRVAAAYHLINLPFQNEDQETIKFWLKLFDDSDKEVAAIAMATLRARPTLFPIAKQVAQHPDCPRWALLFLLTSDSSDNETRQQKHRASQVLADHLADSPGIPSTLIPILALLPEADLEPLLHRHLGRTLPANLSTTLASWTQLLIKGTYRKNPEKMVSTLAEAAVSMPQTGPPPSSWMPFLLSLSLRYQDAASTVRLLNTLQSWPTAPPGRNNLRPSAHLFQHQSPIPSQIGHLQTSILAHNIPYRRSEHQKLSADLSAQDRATIRTLIDRGVFSEKTSHLEFLRAHVDEITHRSTRMVLLWLLNAEDELKLLLSKMLHSDSNEELIYAVRLLASTGEHQVTMEALRRLDAKKLSAPERQMSDRLLVELGLAILARGDSKTDLRLVREAAQRRASPTTIHELRNLGLDKEAARQSHTGQASPFRSQRRSWTHHNQNRSPENDHQYKKFRSLLNEKKITEALHLGSSLYFHKLHRDHPTLILTAVKESQVAADFLDHFLKRYRHHQKEALELAESLDLTESWVTLAREVLEKKPCDVTLLAELMMKCPVSRSQWHDFLRDEHGEIPENSLILLINGLYRFSGKDPKAHWKIPLSFARDYLEEQSTAPNPRTKVMRQLLSYTFMVWEQKIRKHPKGDPLPPGEKQRIRQFLEAFLPYPGSASPAFDKMKAHQNLLGYREETLTEFALRELMSRTTREGRQIVTGSFHDHLLASHRGQGFAFYPLEIEKLLRENQPAVWKMMDTARQMAAAPNGEEASKIYEQWFTEIPEGHARFTKVAQLTHWLCLQPPPFGEWQRIHERWLLVEPTYLNWASSASLMDWWFSTIHRPQDTVPLIEDILSHHLASPENWLLISSLKPDVFRTFFNQSLSQLKDRISFLTTHETTRHQAIQAVYATGLYGTVPLVSDVSLKDWAKALAKNPKNIAIKQPLLAPVSAENFPHQLSLVLKVASFFHTISEVETEAAQKVIAEFAVADPILAQLFKSTETPGWKAQAVDFWNKHGNRLLPLKKSHPKIFHKVVVEVIQPLHLNKLRPALASAVQELTSPNSQAISLHQRAQDWIKAGAPLLPKDDSGRETLSLPVEVFSTDPELAAEMMVTFLNRFRHTSERRHRLMSQFWNKLDHVGSNRHQFLRQLVRYVDSFHHHATQLDPDTLTTTVDFGRPFLGRHFCEQAWLEALPRDLESDLDRFQKAIDELFNGLSPRQKRLLALCLVRAIGKQWPTYREQQEARLDWLKESGFKTHPEIQDLLQVAIALYPGHGKLTHKQAEELTPFLFADKDISQNFVFQALNTSGNSAIRLFSTPTGLAQIDRHLNELEHLREPLSRAGFHSALGSLVRQLSETPIDGRRKFLRRVISLLPHQNQGHDPSTHSMSQLVKLALALDDNEALTSLAEKKPGVIQNDISTLWRIFQHGRPTLVQELARQTNPDQWRHQLGHYHTSVQEQMLSDFSALFPVPTRLLLAVELQTRPDASGDEQPLVTRPQRLQNLIQRFEKEAPRNPDHQYRILNKLATDRGTFALLRPYDEAAVKGRSLTELLQTENTITSQEERLFRRQAAIRLALRATLRGDLQPARQELAKLKPLLDDKRQRDQAFAAAEGLLAVLGEGFIKQASVSPAQAKALLVEVNEHLECFANPSDRHHNDYGRWLITIWTSMIVHTFAGQLEDWTTDFRQRRKLGQYGRHYYERAREIAMCTEQAPAVKERFLQTLMQDPSFLQSPLRDKPHLLKELVQLGMIDPIAFARAVDALPEDFQHLRTMQFRAADMHYYFNFEDEDEALSRYQHLLDQTDEKEHPDFVNLLHYALSRVYRRLGEPDKAKHHQKQVDRKRLPSSILRPR